jgi:hypothetical protein
MVQETRSTGLGTILLPQLVQRACIQGPQWTSLHTNGLFAFEPSFQAKIAFLHLRIRLFPVLGRTIRASLVAEPAARVPAHTRIPVHHHNPVLLSLEDGPHRAGLYAGRLLTVMAGDGKVGYKHVREFSLLQTDHPPPVCGSGRDVVPVLACHTAGIASHTSRLVEVKSKLHRWISYTFSIWTRRVL